MMRALMITALLAAALIGAGMYFEQQPGPESNGVDHASETGTTFAALETDAGPYYFIAIHCEPYNGHPEQDRMIAQDYDLLREMIARADQYGIKLTLMFTPQWAHYIAADAGRMAELDSWRQSGHEIAAHHHSVWHGSWDGYTDYPEEVYSRATYGLTGVAPPYNGSLDDFSRVMRKLDPDMDSGCLNEEYDKGVLPDSFTVSSCSGYLNYGTAGDRAERGSRVAGDGWNDFIVTGEWNGIKRSWLTHYRITNGRREQAVEDAMSSRDYGIYGAVTHSKDDQVDPFL